MYPVSSAYKTAIVDATATREFHAKATLYTPSGEVELSDADFSAGSISINEAVVSGNELTLGSVYAADLSFTLKNKQEAYDSMQFKRSKLFVQVSFKLPDNTIEWVPLGRFIITSASLPSTIIEIKCLDYMLLFERPFSDVTIVYPISVKQLILAIAAKCGVNVAPFTGLVNEEYMITAAPADSLTCRGVLSFCAAIVGCNARMNRLGQLELTWYGDHKQAVGYLQTAKNSIDAGLITEQLDNMSIYDAGYQGQITPVQVYELGHRKSFVINSHQVVLSGLQYVDDDVTYQIGSPRYVLQLVKNPLITDQIDIVLNAIWNKIGCFSYVPYTAEVLGNPALQAGDIVQFLSKDGTKIYNSIITNMGYKFRGYQTLKAVGESEEVHNSESPLQAKISKIVRNLKTQSIQQSDYEKAVETFTMLMAGAMGGYPITTENAFYIADNPDLDAAQTVWVWNINGFGKSVTGKDGPFVTGIGADNSIVAWLATFGIVKAENIRIGGSGTQGVLTVLDEADNPLITMNKLGLSLSGGARLIGGNGVLSSFIFTGGGETSSLDGNWCTLGFMGFSGDGIIERREVAIDYFLPTNFVVTEAKIQMNTVCRYAAGAYFDGGIQHTGFGYPRVIKLAKKIGSTGLIPVFSIYSSYEDENYGDAGRYTDISSAAFGATSYNPVFPSTVPPSSAQYIITASTADIKTNIVSGSWQRLILWCNESYSGSGDEGWWAFQHTGEIIAQLSIIGYMK